MERRMEFRELIDNIKMIELEFSTKTEEIFEGMAPTKAGAVFRSSYLACLNIINQKSDLSKLKVMVCDDLDISESEYEQAVKELKGTGYGNTLNTIYGFVKQYLYMF